MKVSRVSDPSGIDEHDLVRLREHIMGFEVLASINPEW